ncbi:MAG TPA: FtsH protease activity modulator HflK [Roseiarcus sp.]|nr:FtsH protease activity modulator HflK [Roseiarcus sp.]
MGAFGDENRGAAAPPAFAEAWRRASARFSSPGALKAIVGRRGRVIAALALLLWASTGVYKVQPDEQGVVLRFGKWIETRDPGLHFHLPYPIDTVLLPQVTLVNQLQLGGDASDPHGGPATRLKQMLTGDENIVEADGAVSWRIKDAGQFLFQVDQPELAVRLAAESALREVIGRTPIQAALSDKRQQIADETKDLLQRLLDAERAGIEVTQVQLERVDPPAAVIDAFNDVQRARADQERARNEAEAYANDVLPRARGEADRIGQEAEAYRKQAVYLAEGEAKSFLVVYESYRRAEDVTAWRLYLDGVDEVLRKSQRVIIEATDKNSPGVTPYLPLTEMKPKPPAASDGAAK